MYISGSIADMINEGVSLLSGNLTDIDILAIRSTHHNHPWASSV